MPRLRELGITIGDFPTGKYNAITDVEGVQVGHTTVIHDEPRIARTGITVIKPRIEPAWDNHCFAAYHVLNGAGEMTGLPWLEESGLLTSYIALTNTHQVGTVHSALVKHIIRHAPQSDWVLPVVTETYDGFLNDINAFHLTEDHVEQAIASASGGIVAEGNVGGGTGMVCHEFKGGIGTSSRIVTTPFGQYVVGVLVQANYGMRELLRVNGVPVGKHFPIDMIPSPKRPKDGSIIIIVATDAPLLPTQCKRLAQRATIGLARVGGTGHDGSGDIFLAFSTGNALPDTSARLRDLQMLPHAQMNPLFDATAEATEEAILNAMTSAETMTGYRGTVYALPTHELADFVLSS